jgi:hypothetical protein
MGLLLVCPGHRGVLLHRRSLIAVYLAFGALASFRRRYQGSVFAIGREHAMEGCQIGSRPVYLGCQAIFRFMVTSMTANLEIL